MWDRQKEAEQMAGRRRDFLEKGFEIFSEKGIEAPTLLDVAKAAGCGSATIYRYFDKKPGFVVAVASWKWGQFKEENQSRRPNVDFDGMTAAEIFEFYLDSFLELYRKHSDLLRFNQFFNVYVRSERVDMQTLEPYQDVIDELRAAFHRIYLKAQQDKTIRTDGPEEEMFSTTLHLMLAAVTRYAVGLVYIPEGGFEAEKELITLKEALFERYKGIE